VKIFTPYVSLILLCGLLCCNSSFAQLEQPNRYELERKSNDADFTVISLKEDGIALIRETNRYKSGNRTWEVILLDTALQKTGLIEIELDNQNRFIGYETSSKKVHFLFLKNEVSGVLDLISIDTESKEIDRHEINPGLTYQLTHFYKVADNFILGGLVNKEPAILLYSTSRKNISVVPGIFQKQAELIDIQVNKNQTFNTLLLDRSNRGNKKIIFRTHDSSGKLLLEDITSIDSDVELHTAISSTLEKEDLIILGSWGKFNSRQASGFYSLAINPFSDQTINRSYFAQLDHYLDYLKPKKAAAVKAKSSKSLEAGKIPDFTNYIIPYKLVEHTNGFLLLAESFTPSSGMNETSSSYYIPAFTYPYKHRDVYSNNQSYDNRYPPENNIINPLEIKSNQAVVISYDANGSIQWDHSIKFDNMKTSLTEHVADFLILGDKIHILYKKESEIRIKSIDLDNSESIKKTVKIKLTDPYDEVRMERTDEGSVKYWFNNSFYVWGYQSIRNKPYGAYRTREVFYINKIVVH